MQRGCALGRQPANKSRVCVKLAAEEILSGRLPGEGLDGLVWTAQGCRGSALSREETPSQTQHGLQVTCARWWGQRLLAAPSPQPALPSACPLGQRGSVVTGRFCPACWPEQSLVARSTRAVKVQSASAGRKAGRALEMVHNPWRAYFPRSDWATWAP